MMGEAETVFGRIKRDFVQYRWGIAAAGIAVTVLELLFHTICPMRLMLGLPCPGCGITRALGLFFTGHFAEAFAMHPAYLLILLGVPLFILFRYFIPKRFTIFMYYVIITIGVLLILYLYRMASGFPGEEPICAYPEDCLPLRIIRGLLAERRV